MRNGQKLKVATFTCSIMPSTLMDVVQLGVHRPTTIVPHMPCVQVLQWLCLPPTTLWEVPSMLSIIYNQLLSILSFPIASNNTFTFTKGYQLVCPLVFNFHHQGVIVTLMWQLIAWCSKGHQVVNPITLYPRRNVKMLSQGNILLIQNKLLYFPHLGEE